MKNSKLKVDLFVVNKINNYPVTNIYKNSDY